MGKAAQLFSGNAPDSLINRLTPSVAQREFLQLQWNTMRDAVCPKLRDDSGFPISTWLQGSYKYGTLIKPVHLHEEYDVDVGIYFEWVGKVGEAYPAPEQLRAWVQNRLSDYGKECEDVERIEEPAKERCSRALFKRQFHIDTPVYHLDRSTDTRRLATLAKGWESSDPKPIYKWFRDAASGAEREQLRRLIRYMKGWAAVAFVETPDSRPSSILITVVVTEAFQAAWLERLLGLKDDDDALVDVITRVHNRLFAVREVRNPVDRDEDLNRMTDDAWDAFLSNMQGLRDAAEQAIDANDEAAAALIWSQPFSFLMPLPDVAAVEMQEEVSGRAVMQIPDIEIAVFVGDSKQPEVIYDNEVPGVAKNCWLVFRIKNQHIIPDYATVEWTVRNAGYEADGIGDLGHRKMGMRLLTVREHTRYSGKHYMDCVVRVNGQVYAARRVVVHIKNILRAERNPPKPAYTKLVSRLRRRR
ncbi:cyclic GMP-AMP synthase DncV-like nucleotidyltransferase [Janthinobacterium sp. DSP2-3-3]|uniref:cyclic GMP-AMP synthase DncV-like nucleotidyltransferase n=1 Tax=Janthinobacterium sp. DSP2-3-3 TaxID=2804596 RepID=UPI003CEDC4AE